MLRWLLRCLMLALLGLSAGALGGCASTGATDGSDQYQHEDRRRDSPFYVPFSA